MEAGLTRPARRDRERFQGPCPTGYRQGGNMPKHRGLIVVGFVFALAVLSPASALGKARGTDRPVKGTASGNVTVTLGAPLGITIDLTGVATHFGKYRVHLEADGVIVGGEVVGNGTFT